MACHCGWHAALGGCSAEAGTWDRLHVIPCLQLARHMMQHCVLPYPKPMPRSTLSITLCPTHAITRASNLPSCLQPSTLNPNPLPLGLLAAPGDGGLLGGPVRPPGRRAAGRRARDGRVRGRVPAGVCPHLLREQERPEHLLCHRRPPQCGFRRGVGGQSCIARLL